MVKKIAVGLLGMLLATAIEAQTPRHLWVDSVFSQMDIAEKIGQLFMITIPPDLTESDLDAVLKQISSSHIGGVLYQTIPAADQATMSNTLQSAAQVPLLIASRGVYNAKGLSPFPDAISQGAITNDSLIFQFGRMIGRRMNSLGIQMTFVPANVAGATNVEERGTFGEDRFSVAAKALSFWNGVRAEGVLATAEYFPVQGLSVHTVDKGLPSIKLTVDSVQAYPFKVLFRDGIPAVLPGSADLPLFYSRKKTALRNMFSSATLTASFAGEWIRHNMEYNGLIMIDIDNMVRSTDKFKNGDAEVFAFRAGNEMLVTSDNINPAARKMRRLLRKEPSYMAMLDDAVKKILALKYNAGLSGTKVVEQPDVNKISRLRTRLLSEEMYRAAVTVVSNNANVLPIQTLENKTFRCIIAGDSAKGNIFAAQLARYVPITVTHLGADIASEPTDTLQRQRVIVAAILPNASGDMVAHLLTDLKEAQINRDVIICDFGSTLFRKHAGEFTTVITGLSDDEAMLRIVPQAIFGALPVQGVLPLSFGSVSSGRKLTTPAIGRLAYSFPEDAGVDARTLEKIEAIAREAIESRATPGCQVLVAKNGKVIYERAFGHLTYEEQTPVTANTIYDLASLTKVSATLQAIMFLYEKGLIDIYKKASAYLPDLRGSNKQDITLKDILTHQAGLWPFLPFWTQTMNDTAYYPEFYSNHLSREYPLVVSDNLFASIHMKDSLWHWIVKARVREKPTRTPFDYRYSDMGFYILYRLAERLLNQPMEDFLWQNLYEPLGATTLGYQPLLRFPVSQIAPTENDKLFRKSLLIGTVHDQGAAMLGGVAGHAGLFGNAAALGKLGQMLLQEGTYGGIRYYKPETVRLFTQQQFLTNRRGLGWDRPTGTWDGPTGRYASPRTFGHTGFTGTCLWVDPEFNLVYVFLSNRVHPNMTNNKLLEANIRPRIQDVIYQAIFNYCKTAEEPERPIAVPYNAMGRLYNN